MENRTLTLTPSLSKILSEFGGNIKLARLRRRLTTEQVCARADISRTTLWQIEKGMHNVTIGAYAQVLFILGLEKDLQRVSVDDELGRRLQDADLEVRQRGPRKK
ncbi:MAG: helix-turn-helix transcriptional regulator [Gemmatimonadaceae bacterium]|nr:helix-turn-helix transcriptional regulator [Chitinophagaceae bacterium]